MASTLDLLNELLALHSCSLPSYLSCAKPWSHVADSKDLKALELIAKDHLRMVERIGQVILRHNGKVRSSDFPMLFTDMHDLSTDYILNQVRRRQKNEFDRIIEIVEQLQNSPDALAIAEEAKGAARGHLEQLEELQTSSSV